MVQNTLFPESNGHDLALLPGLPPVNPSTSIYTRASYLKFLFCLRDLTESAAAPDRAADEGENSPTLRVGSHCPVMRGKALWHL